MRKIFNLNLNLYAQTLFHLKQKKAQPEVSLMAELAFQSVPKGLILTYTSK